MPYRSCCSGAWCFAFFSVVADDAYIVRPSVVQVLDDGKVKSGDDLTDLFATPDKANEMVKLHAFCPFEDTTNALAGACSVIDGKLDKSLKKFLKKSIVDQELKDKVRMSVCARAYRVCIRMIMCVFVHACACTCLGCDVGVRDIVFIKSRLGHS